MQSAVLDAMVSRCMSVLTLALAVNSTTQLIVTKASDTDDDGVGMLGMSLWQVQGKLCIAQSTLSFTASLYMCALLIGTARS